MRKVEAQALTASLVLLLVLSVTARLAQAQRDSRRDDGDRDREGRDSNRRDDNSNAAGESSAKSQETSAAPTAERGRSDREDRGSTRRDTNEDATRKVPETAATTTASASVKAGPAKGYTKGLGKTKSGVVPASDLTLKVEIGSVKVLECPDCGENAVVSVAKNPNIHYVPGTMEVAAFSCTHTEEQMGGVWIEADLKLKSDSKFTEGNVDFITRTFDCCNPISLQYSPLAEDACDVLSANHRCFKGSGCHKQYGCLRSQSNKVCLKPNTLTKMKLKTLLVGLPDALGLQTGCKQTEGLFVDGNTNEVIGCLRVQWTVCIDKDCGGSEICGCGDGSLFNNPRCGKCSQPRAERLGICADFFTFAQSPAEACEWRECCCDGDGTAGGTPCSTGNVGCCDDKSCRRHH